MTRRDLETVAALRADAAETDPEFGNYLADACADMVAANGYLPDRDETRALYALAREGRKARILRETGAPDPDAIMAEHERSGRKLARLRVDDGHARGDWYGAKLDGGSNFYVYESPDAPTWSWIVHAQNVVGTPEWQGRSRSYA